MPNYQILPIFYFGYFSNIDSSIDVTFKKIISMLCWLNIFVTETGVYCRN